MIRSIFDDHMLSSLLPHSIAVDDQIKAIAAAIDPHLQLVSRDIKQAIFLARLDDLSEQLIDLLANQFHTDFFDDQMTLDQKKSLIRDAIADHRTRGTPAAVERYSRMIYRAADVAEWFQYGGRPYYFKLMIDITSDDEDTTYAARDRLRYAVNIGKNVRSWLEVIVMIVNYVEDVTPPDDSLALRALFNHADTYDYRAVKHFHDGSADYGDDPRKYDGSIDHGGDHTSGALGQINYGRTQADDFDLLLIKTTLIHSEDVHVSDAADILNLSLDMGDRYDYRAPPAAIHDGSSDHGRDPHNYDGSIDHGGDHTSGALGQICYGHSQADDFETGYIAVRRPFYADGRYTADGSISYDGASVEMLAL